MAGVRPHIKYNPGSAGFVGEQDGVKTSVAKKRHSFFGRSEPMSGLNPSNPPSLAGTASVQGVLYHNLAQRPSLDLGERRATDPLEQRRRSFFPTRWRLHKKEEPQKQEEQAIADSASAKGQHTRGQSLPSEIEDTRDPCYSEDEYYRKHRKQSISPPFNFQHVTHTHKKHLPALETVDEKDLTKEFWAASAYQAPRRQLNGIQADDLAPKLEALGVPRGAPSPRASTPVRTDSDQSPPPRIVEPGISSSREDITALPGIASPEPTRPSFSSRREDLSSLLGVKPKPQTTPREPPQPATKLRKENLSALNEMKDKRSNESKDSTRQSGKQRHQDLGSLLGFRERASIDSTRPSTKPRKDDVASLLGLNEKDTRRSNHQSKRSIPQEKKDDINALLGIPAARPPAKRTPPAPPAPPRPKRSDEDTHTAFRSDGVTTFQSSQAPERPPRDDDDMEFLRDTGLAQLLYRTESNRSDLIRTESNRSDGTADPHQRRMMSPVPGEPRVRTPDEIDQPVVGEAPVYPSIGFAFGAVADDVEKVPLAHAQQVKYRAKQPLPALPSQTNPIPEMRSPLHPVSEGNELPSPLPSPSDIGISPRSPNSLHSAQRAVGVPRNTPELTGPGMPDDESWEDEIDFLYKQEAEATSDFKWENVGPQSQQVPELDDPKRLSLTLPPATPQVAPSRLPKKLSEGSLRTSHHKSASRDSMNPVGHRGFLNARKHNSRYENRIDENTVMDARASPEVKVIDVDDKRPDSALPTGAVHMHGYESLAAGYLSDPESANSVGSQHRKSSSYGSYESIARRSVTVNSQQGRSSNASINSIPDLMHTAWRSKPTAPTSHAPTRDILPQTTYTSERARSNLSQHNETVSTPEFTMRRPDAAAGESMIMRNAGRASKENRSDPRRYSRLIQPAPPTNQQHSNDSDAGWI